MDTDLVEIPTWTEPATLDFLAHQARNSTHAVEIGCYYGATARVMLRANPSLHLWTVDKFDVFGSKQITEMFLDKWIKSGNCEIIVGDSTKAATMLRHMREMVDLCFVDDGHQDWQVLADIRNFLPLMAPNGVLCGHDYDKTNDVAQGVHQSGIKFDVPVPRLWRMVR